MKSPQEQEADASIDLTTKLKDIDNIQKDLKEKIILDVDFDLSQESYKSPMNVANSDKDETNTSTSDISMNTTDRQLQAEIQKEIDKLNLEQDELVQLELDKIYNKKVIVYIFLVIFVANIFMNIDHGAIPACFEQLQKKFGMNHFQYGILASMVFGGLMVGSLVSTALYSRGDYIKSTLIISLALCILSLMAFTMTSSYYLSLAIRFATGFLQIFMMAYQPVWSDTFCAEKYKSIALTINMLASPIGIVGGYGLTYYMDMHHSWEWAFYLQSLALGPCTLILFLTPQKYLNVEEMINVKKRIQTEVAGNILARLDRKSSKEAANDVEQNSDLSIEDQVPDEEQLKRALIENQKKKEKALQGFNTSDKLPFGQTIKEMLQNKIYCGLVFSISGLYFIVTGIQYWISQYMQDVLGASAELAFIYFVVLCFTGPIVGAIVGGIMTAWVGGYNSKNGQILTCIGGILAVLLGAPIPFCTNIHMLVVFLWFLLFFGGFIQPQMIGIMLNSVKEKQKISANSLAQIAFNLIGYLPAPTFYGFILQMCKDKKSKIPMGCLIYVSFPVVLALLFSVFRKLQKEGKYRERKRLQSEQTQKALDLEPSTDDKDSLITSASDNDAISVESVNKQNEDKVEEKQIEP